MEKTKNLFRVMELYMENASIDQQRNFLKSVVDLSKLEYALVSNEYCRDINGNFRLRAEQERYDFDNADVKEFLDSLNSTELDFLVYKGGGSQYVEFLCYDAREKDSGLRKYIENQVVEKPYNFDLFKNSIKDFRNFNMERNFEEYIPLLNRNPYLECKQLLVLTNAQKTGLKPEMIKLLSNEAFSPEQMALLCAVAQGCECSYEQIKIIAQPEFDIQHMEMLALAVMSGISDEQLKAIEILENDAVCDNEEEIS